MSYQVKKIGELESEIKDLLDIIRRYGEDISEYEHTYNSIQELLNGTSDKKTEYGYSSQVRVNKLSDEKIYNQALDALERLKENLDSKQSYLTIYFRNNSLKQEVKKFNDFADTDKLDTFVAESKKLIKDVLNTENVKNSIHEYRDITSEVFNTIYEVIKLEIICNCKSSLLDYVISNKLGIPYLNDAIREDIEKLMQNPVYNKEIERVVNEISKEGINYTYANEELLLLIVLRNDERINSRLIAKAEEYKKQSEELYSKLRDELNLYKDELPKYNSKKKNNRTKALVSAIALAASLLTCKGVEKIVKHANTTTTYTETIEAYDTYTGKIRTVDFNTTSLGNKSVNVKVYGPVNEKGIREVISYRVKDTDLEDIKEYADLIEKETSYSTDRYQYNAFEQLTNDKYTTVERVNYGDKEITFNDANFNKNKKTLYIIADIIATALGIPTATFLAFMLYNASKEKAAKNNNIKFENGRKKKQNIISKYEELRNSIIDFERNRNIESMSPEEYRELVRK